MEKKLTNADLRSAYFKWRLFAEVSHSFERYQALGMTAAIGKCLKKLYPDDEDYKAALVRHMQFFNTEATIGAVIPGIALSLEEDRAAGEDVPDELISSVKTGLMGPMAGIGDTLIWGTLKTLCFSIATTLALGNNIPGEFIMLIAFSAASYFIGWGLWKSGYKLGRGAVTNLLKSGTMNKIIQSCSILGLMMMGALSASYISLSIPVEFSLANSESPIVIQEVLDGILPGILPLVAVFLIYHSMKKKNRNFNVYVLLILGISLLCSAIGIL